MNFSLNLVAVSFVLCCSAYAQNSDFAQADAKWKEQSTKNDPARIKFLMAVLDEQNSLHLDEQGDCYKIPGDGVTQIVIFNADGIIQSVISEIESAKSECFKSLYLGRKTLKPPYAPIYDKMEMGYRKLK
jgi:hypothetical protein